MYVNPVILQYHYHHHHYHHQHYHQKYISVHVITVVSSSPTVVLFSAMSLELDPFHPHWRSPGWGLAVSRLDNCSILPASSLVLVIPACSPYSDWPVSQAS